MLFFFVLSALLLFLTCRGGTLTILFALEVSLFSLLYLFSLRCDWFIILLTLIIIVSGAASGLGLMVNTTSWFSSEGSRSFLSWGLSKLCTYLAIRKFSSNAF